MKNISAFPGLHPSDECRYQDTGMTLRDYFAAKSLQSLITEALRLDHVKWDATAEHAYLIADAMMKARK